MLPFLSIEEAEVALGRPLSFCETLWFKYTGSVSDMYLYFINILLLFLVFNLTPLPSVLMEITKFKGLEKYKLQPGIYNPPASIYQCYKSVMYTFFTVVGPLQLLSYPAIKIIGIRTSLPLPSVWEVLAQLMVCFVVEDFTNYWIHRWLHSSWGYSKIHYMHHEFTAPMGFAAPYAHWAEILLLGIPSFLGPALVPGHIVTLYLWIALRQIEAIEIHGGYDFAWNPTKLIPFYGGAEYHDYHHFIGGKSQSNFSSVFTYCDYIYGTDKGYRYQKDFLAQMRKVKSNGGTGEIGNDTSGEMGIKFTLDKKWS